MCTSTNNKHHFGLLPKFSNWVCQEVYNSNHLVTFQTFSKFISCLNTRKNLFGKNNTLFINSNEINKI